MAGTRRGSGGGGDGVAMSCEKGITATRVCPPRAARKEVGVAEGGEVATRPLRIDDTGKRGARKERSLLFFLHLTFPKSSAGGRNVARMGELYNTAC